MAEIRSNSIQTGYTGLTYADIVSFLGVTVELSEQMEIESFIKAYEASLVKLCNRNFAHGDETVYFDTYDMDGRDTFYTYNYPIKEVQKIIIDGATYYEKDGTSNIYTLDTDFYNATDSVTFETLLTLRKRQAMKIYYTIDQFWDDDVVLGLKQWVSELQQNKQYVGKDVRKFSFASYAVEFGNIATSAELKSKVPPYILDVVSYYRKVLI